MALSLFFFFQEFTNQQYHERVLSKYYPSEVHCLIVFCSTVVTFNLYGCFRTLTFSHHILFYALTAHLNPVTDIFVCVTVIFSNLELSFSLVLSKTIVAYVNEMVNDFYIFILRTLQVHDRPIMIL